MGTEPITRDNIPASVDSALAECKAQIADAKGTLYGDLEVAIAALELIKSELNGEIPQRPRRQRSAQFIRYIIDSNDNLAMDAQLKDRIVKIESIYDRFV